MRNQMQLCGKEWFPKLTWTHLLKKTYIIVETKTGLCYKREHVIHNLERWLFKLPTERSMWSGEGNVYRVFWKPFMFYKSETFYKIFAFILGLDYIQVPTTILLSQKWATTPPRVTCFSFSMANVILVTF